MMSKVVGQDILTEAEETRLQQFTNNLKALSKTYGIVITATDNAPALIEITDINNPELSSLDYLISPDDGLVPMNWTWSTITED